MYYCFALLTALVLFTSIKSCLAATRKLLVEAGKMFLTDKLVCPLAIHLVFRVQIIVFDEIRIPHLKQTKNLFVSNVLLVKVFGALNKKTKRSILTVCLSAIVEQYLIHRVQF